MQSIAVFNNKGGVGKTTLLCNIASFLSIERHAKVLVVDADPQCNATQYMFDEEYVESVYSSQNSFTIQSIVKPLAAGKGFTEKIVPHRSDNFLVDVIIGDPKLALSEDLLAEDWASATAGKVRGLRTTFLFKHLLKYCRDYDYVIFDMGPSLGSINRAVLIACDYFVVPMSIDIFSIRAAENISTWMKGWKKGLERGLEMLDDTQDLEVDVDKINLKFAGYVSQQYTAKTGASGERIAVKAYERIMRQIPNVIEKHFVKQFGLKDSNATHQLGEVPNLHSLVPLGQTSRKPIFTLRSADGVVGAHFTKVKEAKSIFEQIVDNLLMNLGDTR